MSDLTTTWVLDSLSSAIRKQTFREPIPGLMGILMDSSKVIRQQDKALKILVKTFGEDKVLEALNVGAFEEVQIILTPSKCSSGKAEEQ